jgi:hypothetical protein
MGNLRHQEQQRLLIAMEAAKHMWHSGMKDFQRAKRKACQQLGVADTRHLPSNEEIRQALLQYQSLFKADVQPRFMRHFRETAQEAMQFFEQFKPRLTGDVLAGTVNQHSSVELHLFADFPEQVRLFLMQENIPFEQKQKRFCYRNDDEQQVPVYSFLADDVAIELMVFPTESIRHSPRSPVDGKPMARANLKTVKQLLDDQPSSLNAAP